MESVQIKGVDSTVRKTIGTLDEDTNFIISEKIMTHGEQYAETLFSVSLNGENASTHVTSRSVATEKSKQKFISRVYGNTKCFAHVGSTGIFLAFVWPSNINSNYLKMQTCSYFQHMTLFFSLTSDIKERKINTGQ